MPLLLRLSLLWKCHMWYLYNLSSCLYNCRHPYHRWHYRWFHFAPHHFLCLYIYDLLFPLHFWTWSSFFFNYVFPLKNIFLGEFVVTFFLFFSVICISSLVLLTLASRLCEFSFSCTNKYWKIFANTTPNWQVFFLSPLLSLTYLYHGKLISFSFYPLYYP